jgi:hypothetical protein
VTKSASEQDFCCPLLTANSPCFAASRGLAAAWGGQNLSVRLNVTSTTRGHCPERHHTQLSTAASHAFDEFMFHATGLPRSGDPTHRVPLDLLLRVAVPRTPRRLQSN